MNPGASNEELFSHLNETPFNFKGFAYHPEMCRKGCGYYGNPIWHGYCSSCWIMQRQKSQARPLTDGFRHHTGTLLIKPDKGRTEEKSEKLDTTRDICCSTKTNNHHYPQTICKTLLPTDIPDYLYCLSLSSLRTLAQGDFSDFLKALQRPDAQPLMTLCTKFIQWLQNAEDLSLESKGDRVQEFYCRIADRYPDQLTEERDQLLSNIEKLVMTQLYKSVFCLDGSLDEQKDISLQKRIRSLKWVTPQMLQLPMDEDNLEVKDWIFSAITALVELDSKRAPQDKLACLSRASNFLFKAIRAYKEEPATTDDFLSCLVYTILKANPPRLSSNLQYITKFCNPKKLVIGEEGYCFTNTCCAVSFIEMLDSSSLGIKHEEFTQMMQQSGEVGTNQKLEIEQDAVQQMQHNKKLLEELHNRQDRLLQTTESLRRELNDWSLAIEEEVKEIICRFPLATQWTSTSHN